MVPIDQIDADASAGHHPGESATCPYGIVADLIRGDRLRRSTGPAVEPLDNTDAAPH